VSPARLAARCLALLGPVGGAVAVVGPGSARLAAAFAERGWVQDAGEPPALVVVVFLGSAAPPAERQRLLRDLQRRLPPAARVLLVDHSQPRTWWRRALALPGLVARGLRPARARYPTAREAAALGFTVERLALASGERVQLVVARVADAASR
jgi:hypothetical protein